MEDLLYLSVLFEYYGVLLTKRQFEICDMYLNQNLSLGEISECIGISRQGVRDSLVKAEKLLKEYEDKLKIYHKNTLLSQHLVEIDDIINKSGDLKLSEKVSKITEKIGNLI